MNQPAFEIIAIGREILDGRVIDTNSVHLALELKKRGWTPRFGQRVDDDEARILDSFRIAQNRSTHVFVTGGLGPTQDDITVEVFAKFCGQPLELNPEGLKTIEAYFAKMSRTFTDVQKKQVMLPKNGTMLTNKVGTAPGLHFDFKGCQWYFMPGVPREMKLMFDEQVIPTLPRRDQFSTTTWRTHFTSEGELQTRLLPVLGRIPAGWEVSFRTRFPENHIGLYAVCDSDERIQLQRSLQDQITKLLGDDVFSIDSGTEVGGELEQVVVNLAKLKRRTVATVESCTGGLITHRLTNVSGASEVFYVGNVCYDNAAKIELGVDPNVLADDGAVSAACAKQLAERGLAGLERLDPKRGGICLATTGIAGPRGGSEAKPVGLCFIAVAATGLPTRTSEVRIRAGWEREDYKRAFAQKALDEARRLLLEI